MWRGAENYRRVWAIAARRPGRARFRTGARCRRTIIPWAESRDREEHDAETRVRVPPTRARRCTTAFCITTVHDVHEDFIMSATTPRILELRRHLESWPVPPVRDDDARAMIAHARVARRTSEGLITSYVHPKR